MPPTNTDPGLAELGLEEKLVEKLTAAGLLTRAAIVAERDSHGDLIHLEGIGEVSDAAIAAAVEAYDLAQPPEETAETETVKEDPPEVEIAEEDTAETETAEEDPPEVEIAEEDAAETEIVKEDTAQAEIERLRVELQTRDARIDELELLLPEGQPKRFGRRVAVKLLRPFARRQAGEVLAIVELAKDVSLNLVVDAMSNCLAGERPIDS